MIVPTSPLRAISKIVRSTNISQLVLVDKRTACQPGPRSDEGGTARVHRQVVIPRILPRS